MILLKALLLAVAIVYTFKCVGLLIRGLVIASLSIWLMAIGIVGFVALQFWLGV